MTDYKPGDLWMYVRSEPYEVECDECGKAPFFASGITDHVDATGIITEQACPACHGTGHRTVRLTGFVEITDSGEYYGGRTYRVNDTDINTYQHSIAEELVERCRAGTLPESVTRWLDVEIIEEADDENDDTGPVD